MKNTSAALFPLLMLLMLAGLTFWLERASQPVTSTSGAARHDPDYTVDNFTIQRFDAQGKLYQTLVAEHMSHYPDDDSSFVRKPRMTYHTARPTRMSSDEAWLDSGAKTVQMEKNVKVVHSNAGRPDTEITTSSLTILSDEEIARTNAPVTITQGKSVLNGIGMESNNKTQISVLKSSVRGSIESAKSPAK